MRLRFLAVAAVLLGVSLAARADSVNFTLNSPDQMGGPGSTLSYSATVAAPSSNTGLEYLNGLAFNVSGSFLIGSDSFFDNFPFFLTPGQSYTNVLFTLSGTGQGMFPGTISLLGGSTADTYSALGTSAFSATVTGTTPEPSSLLMLGTGLLGALGVVRRKLA